MCSSHSHAQCDFEIPLTETFPCYFGSPTIDYSQYASPPGGTFSGPGMSADGVFTATDAVQGPGSSSSTETITITYEVDINGSPCTVSDDILLGVPEVAFIEPIPTIYCESDPQISLTGSPGMGTPYALFTINDVPPFGNDEFFPAYYAQQYGTGQFAIVYNYLDLGSGCYSRDTVFVDLYSEAELNDMTVISEDEIPELLCLSSPIVSLNPVPSDGVLSGNGVVGNTFDPALAGLGAHTIYFEYTTPQGACSTIDSTTIDVVEPFADFIITASACAGEVDTLTYTGTEQDGSLNLNWEITGANVETNLGDTVLYVLAPDVGTYDIELSVTGAIDCFDVMASDQVDKFGLVTVETIEDQVVGLDSQDLLLETTADSNDGSTITFQWSPPEGLSCTDCQEPTLSPTGDQTFMVIATDANGCTASDELNITLDFTKNIYVPNAFTPNNDGKNDIFNIYGHGIEEVNLQIFDRWGTLVFETSDHTIGWDGTYAGEPLNNAVFYYSLQAKFVDGDERQKTGDITLIR